jgi:TRAP-type C4-dicarboxylate transport system permease small subunit
MGFERIFDRANLIPVVLSGAAVTMMMLHVCIDVIGKFLFNAPAPGTITIVTEYYMPILTFLPLAYVHRRRAHISVEVLTKTFSPRVQFHIHYLGLVIVLVVFALLTWTTFGEAEKKYAIGTFMVEQGRMVPTWPGHYFPPIGYGLITLLVAYELLQYLLGRADPSAFD